MLRVLPVHKHAIGERISIQTPSIVLPPLERAESAACVGNVGSGLITKSLIEEEKKLHTAEKVSQEEDSTAVFKPCLELLSNCPEPVSL